MRIIRPLDDMAAVTTSNAPDDEVATWEPEGRDLLEYLDAPIFDVVGDTLIASDRQRSGQMYRMAISSGVVEFLWSAPRQFVKGIAISPDLRYYAAHSVSSSRRSIVVYKNSIDPDHYGAVFYSNVPANFNMSSFQWLQDGTGFVVQKEDTSGVVFVDATTFIETPIFTPSDSEITSLFDHIGGSKSNYRLGATSIAKVGGMFAFTGLVFADTSLGSDTRITVRAKFNADGSSKSVSHSHPDTGLLRYNSARDEVLLFSGNSVLSCGDLDSFMLGNEAVATTVPDCFPADSSIRTTATHLITRSLSSAPYWNYRLLTDYSLDKSLPALPDRGEGIAVGTDYTAVQQNQGIALIQNSDDSIIQQLNPNVTKGDTYIYNDKVYEVLTNNNMQPDKGTAAEPPTWLDLGAINRLRMFDNKIDNVTRGNGSLNITIDAKQALNGIALFNVTAATVQITMTDGTYGLVYDTGEVLMRDTSQIRGWYDWFFSSRPKMRDLARIDLPTFPNAIVEVTLTGDNVSLGEIAIGRVQKIGETQYGGTSVGIIDSSIKERDDFGNFVIAERPFSKRVEFDVHVPTSGISGVQNILASYRAKPVVYVGAEGEEALVVFGFYRDFQINYTSYSIAASTITVEGL